jgi:signal transduction histidine kinase/ActR/RegA family two-component response regulator
MKKLKFFSLKYKLLIFSIAVSVLLTFSLTVVEINYDIESDRKNTRIAFLHFETNHRQYLTNRLWALDYNSINAFIKNQVDQENISAIEIRDPHGERVARTGKIKEGKTLESKFELTYLHNNQFINIGEVYLQGNLPTFREMVGKRMTSIFLVNGLIVAVIFFSSYLLFYWNVLGRILDMTRQLRSDAPLDRVHDTAQALKNRTPDEISVLLDALNERAERIDRVQEQLIQAQKMESVGRLAGGVAHDFNNMLGVILGHTELMQHGLDPSGKIYTGLEQIRNAAQRSSNLTRQLLTFARKQTIAPKVLDLNNAVAGMLDMVRRLIGEDIDLVWQPVANLWPVKIDPSQLDQILANLCINARDAISGVGKISIETDMVLLDEAYCKDHRGFQPGEYVQLSVSDNGCGMDRNTLSHIYEPFFTTKELGKGTGLGLATVYGIVKQNNGFINVYSEPATGTVFRIYLPRHNDAAEPVQTAVQDKPVKQGDETILLVEDEAAIRDLIKETLESLGYTVVPADTPGEAIRLANEQRNRVDGLVTDVVMPKMNGRDLAEQIASLCPGVKTLYMSGYTSNVIAHHGILDKGVHFIEKPFSRKSLAAKLREVLDQSDDPADGKPASGE